MRQTRFSACLFVLLILSLTLIPEPHPIGAQDAVPSLSLSAASGSPGESIVATGSDFAPRTDGTLTWNPSGQLLADVKTRGDGSFRRRFEVPNVAPGNYVIVVQVDNQTAQAPFRIDEAAPPIDTPVSPPTLTPVPTNTPAATSTATPTATRTATASSTPTRTPTSTPAAPSGSTAVLLAAGDIADCNSSGDEATAKLLDGLQGTIATLGDNVYPNGTATEFTNCYHPTWGRHKARTRPSPGNHDYNTSGASGYYGYFGSAAGDPSKGYYSYELGSWHVIALNSSISMAAGSAQEQWLKADLAAHPTGCTLAYWHHPRFSSGSSHGSDARSQPIWQALYNEGVDIVLAGHDHTYERFAPMNASGGLDRSSGIRQFIVGTGGKSHYGFATIFPTSEVRNADTFGVLQLTLRDGSYEWRFVPEAGKTFTDSGSDSCH